MSNYITGLCGAAAVMICAQPVSVAAQTVTYKVNIPAQDLGAALKAFARATHLQITFASEAVRGKRSPALQGSYSAAAALDALLAGSGLSYERGRSGLYLIGPAGQTVVSDASDAVPADIVVTATKRSENVRRISGSVSAKTGEQLEAIGAQSFADYLTRTPGVVFNATIPGLSTVSIRGVSTTTNIDQGQGTTGYFINDVPLTDPYFSVAVPDIDAFDVDNVTVLKGPQGTLFGSASLGGAINYQAAKPDLTAFHAHVQGTISGTRHGDAGASGKIMLNIPIVKDRLAIRAVFYNRLSGGYIHNLGTGQKDANYTVTRGGRVLATLAIDDDTTLNYMFLDQFQHTADTGSEQPLTAGQYAKRTLLSETADFTTIIHNLRLDHEFGFGTLTATATYHKKRQFTVSDLTASFGGLLGGLAKPVAGPQSAYSKGSTFEIRLASPSGQRFEYLIGAYYDRTTENFIDDFTAPGAAGVIETLYSGLFGAGIGARSTNGDSIFTATLPFKGEEGAIFGEATYHLNDRLKVTVGGRGFITRSQNTSTASGFLELLLAGKLSSAIQGSQKESGFTPKGSITWTPSSNVMVYGLVSEGFRFGGPNINPSTPAAPIPPSFKSDSLINYELGARTDLFDRKLQLDGTLYYVDWSDIQVRLSTPTGLAYAANAGKARNYGFEGTATLRPIVGLTIQGNLTYLDARLSRAFDPGGGHAIIPKGTTLPGASKWQVSDSVGYQWQKSPLLPSVTLLHRYISSASSNLTYSGRQGGYNIFDLRTGLQIGNMGVSAFVENIGDARGVTNAQSFPGTPYTQYLIRPRTYGMTVDVKF